MTECERLIAEGTFDPSFFEEEERCGFTVCTMQKKMWAIEMDLVNQIDRVCRKYGLHYVLWAGSMLGAVRHKGFIPWDDDMDVAMVREDYDALLSHADEFEMPYFLQTTVTDPESGYTHAKIRNSNTTAWNRLWGYRHYNFGIYVDIFPFDNLLLEGRQERMEKIEQLAVENSLWMKMPSPYKNERDIARIANHSGRSVLENYLKIQELAKEQNKVPTELVGVAYKMPRLLNKGWPRSMFTDTVQTKFEMFEYPIPKDWEAYLTSTYGDYMEFPPLEKRTFKHAHTIFEPDTPYKEYVIPEYKPYVEYLEYGASENKK